MNRLFPFAIVIAVWLGGCATAKQTYTPSGTAGHSINCSGTALNWGMCYEKAGELCGANGYTIVEKSDDQGAMVTGTQYGLFGSSVMNRSMIVQCNSSKASVRRATSSQVSATPAPAKRQKSAADRLQELEELRERGLISEGDYEAKRAQILAEF